MIAAWWMAAAMGSATGIEWTDRTWSAWTGCQHVSRACDGCYAEALDTRYGKADRWGPHGIRRRTSDAYWAQLRS
jgi:protein gp37